MFALLSCVQTGLEKRRRSRQPVRGVGTFPVPWEMFLFDAETMGGIQRILNAKALMEIQLNRKTWPGCKTSGHGRP